MIESVVALLMFVNAEIKEARLQTEGMAQCLRGKRHAERQFSENVMKYQTSLEFLNRKISGLMSAIKGE